MASLIFNPPSSLVLFLLPKVLGFLPPAGFGPVNLGGDGLKGAAIIYPPILN